MIGPVLRRCLPAVLCAAALALATGSAPEAGRDPARFVDLAPSAGLAARTVIGGERTKEYILETTGGGVAVFDFDGDGWPDIFLVNGSRLSGFADADRPGSRLYRNRRDGSFADVTEKAGLGRHGWGQGACVGDYDNDGQPDLFVTYYGQNALYRNQGDGTFADVTRKSGLLTPEDRWSTGCAFLDYDRDGHLDLFVSAYTAYEDATRYKPGEGKSCTWKGLTVMCGPRGLRGARNALFRGNGDGTFTDVSARAGILGPPPSYGFTPLVLDYDHDGWPDVYVANGHVYPEADRAGPRYSYEQPRVLYRNRGDGRFEDVSLRAGPGVLARKNSRGAAFGDLFNTGRLEVVVNYMNDAPSLLHDCTPRSEHALLVQLVGTRSNKSAIGARVT